MKSLSALLLLLSILLLFIGKAHAEGNCPDGYYPIGGPVSQGAPQACAPIPGYGNGQQPQQSPSRQRDAAPESWVDSFGAIAVDVDHGIVGVASTMATESSATDTAVADCRSRGGAQCKIEAHYRNACGALIAGDTAFNAFSAVTLDEAIKGGMDTCAKGGIANCHVYYFGCSMARRIQ